MTLEGGEDVHGSEGLTEGMRSVGDRVSDDVLKKDLEDTTSLFVDQTGDTLDTTTTSETTDGGLGDTLDVITKDLAMTLGTSLSEALATFAAYMEVELAMLWSICLMSVYGQVGVVGC